MTTRAPWSVKGIDPKAREIAKDRARRSGLTLGEWLSEMISGGHHEAPRAEPEPEEDALEPVLAALQALSERIDASERTQAEQTARLEAAVAEIRAEQAEASWRLKAAEQDGGQSRIDALRSLEGALNRVAARLQAGEGRADEAVAVLHERIDAAAARVGDLEQQLRQAAAAPVEAVEPPLETKEFEEEGFGEDLAAPEPDEASAAYAWVSAQDLPDVFGRETPEPVPPAERVDLVDRTRQSEARAAELREEARTAAERQSLLRPAEPEPPVFEIPKAEVLPAPPVPPAEEHAPLVFAPAPRRPARKPRRSRGGLVLAAALVLLILLIGLGYVAAVHPEALSGITGVPAPTPPAAPKPAAAVAPAAAASLARPPADFTGPARTEPKPPPPT